ncbi:MAG: DUF1016 N-terminal domain-containing protein [Bacteroidaceae bacterium]|nr:DUF1016 N-terminal domain-containing protein [Bacteroidaceae bacterium]
MSHIQNQKKLTHSYGSGFCGRYLRSFRKFYIVVPDITIWKSRFPNLSWTHIFKTLRVEDDSVARWYLETASQQMWSVRTLDRNISTQYYERHFSVFNNKTSMRRTGDVVKITM